MADVTNVALNSGRNAQLIQLSADLDGDCDVERRRHRGHRPERQMTGATWADGDLNADGTVTEADLDRAYAQFGLELVS